jgi:predicted HTH transcriptional regulator
MQEFKRQLDNPKSVAGEIVALANGEGGFLYIGVEDDGTIVGCPDPAQVVQTLTKAVRQSLSRWSAPSWSVPRATVA